MLKYAHANRPLQQNLQAILPVQQDPTGDLHSQSELISSQFMACSTACDYPISCCVCVCLLVLMRVPACAQVSTCSHNSPLQQEVLTSMHA